MDFNRFIKEGSLKPSKKNIKNEHYRQFLDEGIIKPLSEDDILQVLKNIKGRHIKEGRALVICAYYTGARPNEILRIKAKDVKKDRSYIIVKVQGSKKGLPRSIHLPYKKEMVKEFWNFVISLNEERFLFFNYKGAYVRKRKNKQGYIIERIEYADKMRYHFYKWFSVLPIGTVPPYYLRHNRFSKLSVAGVEMNALRMLKGSRTFASIEPYLHMSSEQAKKVARKLD